MTSTVERGGQGRDTTLSTAHVLAWEPSTAKSIFILLEKLARARPLRESARFHAFRLGWMEAEREYGRHRPGVCGEGGLRRGAQQSMAERDDAQGWQAALDEPGSACSAPGHRRRKA